MGYDWGFDWDGTYLGSSLVQGHGEEPIARLHASQHPHHSIRDDVENLYAYQGPVYEEISAIVDSRWHSVALHKTGGWVVVMRTG